MRENFQTMITELRQKYTQLLIVTCVIFFALHVLLIFTLLPESYASGPFYAIHLFFVPLTVFGFYRISRHFERDKKSVAKNAIVYIFLKMMATILFFIPWVVAGSPYLVRLGHQFLVLFFALLIVETLLMVKFIDHAERAENKGK